MRTPSNRTLFTAALAVAAVAACGGGSSTSSSSSSSGTGQQPDVVVGAKSIAFTQKSYEAKAGTIRIELDNQDSVLHNITLRQGNKQVVQSNPKKAETGTVDLQPGSYEFYCSVPGHNMVATLEVK